MGKDKKRDRSRSRERTSKRRNSSNSESSEDAFESRLHSERKKTKELKKLKKRERETSEERRERKAAKKARKEDKKKSKKGSILPSELDYNNMNNPFNDTNLTQTFVWGKKLEKEGKSDLPKRQIEKEIKKRIEKNVHEARDMKRIRDARLAAREDMEMMKRDSELTNMGDWEEKEAKFQLEQAKERTRIRIQQNRAKPIDLLSRYIRFADDKSDVDRARDEEFEMEDPLSYIKDLSNDDYEDLIEDIKVYRRLENDSHQAFWADIRTLIDEELRKRRDDTETIHGSVKAEVNSIFKGKNVEELCTLQRQIEQKLRSGSGNSNYWHGLLGQLGVYIARTRTRELHGKMLRLKLARIREEQMRELKGVEGSVQPTSSVVKTPKKVEKVEEEEEDEEELSKKVRRKVPIAELEDPELDDEQREFKWRHLTSDQLENVVLDLYKAGNYSPPYNAFDDKQPGIDILDAQEDTENLMELRDKNRKKPEGTATDPNEAKMLAIARKGMDGDEATFSVEEQLETQKHLWSEKYRPRKPTYLNRVQTGFDWNKYNQTHYDMDNPPPKIVQGYKFNIFYPDLLDNTKTPQFTITVCDDPDFAIVRFKAGPPYEDIAFKIVNREWEVLQKNGYKCQFQNGVFQLWFCFKKYRYRR